MKSYISGRAEVSPSLLYFPIECIVARSALPPPPPLLFTDSFSFRPLCSLARSSSASGIFTARPRLSPNERSLARSLSVLSFSSLLCPMKIQSRATDGAITEEASARFIRIYSLCHCLSVDFLFSGLETNSNYRAPSLPPSCSSIRRSR